MTVAVPENGSSDGRMGVVIPLRGGRADATREAGLAQRAPGKAQELATGALRSAEDEADAKAAFAAQRALGLAARAVEDLPAAEAHLCMAVDLAVSAGLVVLASEARTHLATVFAATGRTAEALCQLDLAALAAPGPQAARLQAQRAFILQRLGRLDEALHLYRHVLVALRRAGDVESQAKVLTHRGVLHACRGELDAADADLRAAEVRYVRLGEEILAAEVRHNLGFVAARRGDFVGALRWYDRAEVELAAQGVVRPAALLDRCEMLLSVGLVDDALEVGARAVTELGGRGMDADLAEARLLLSQAALLAGDPFEAADLATAARASFARQQRTGWEALAGYALLQATVATGADAAGTLVRARAVVGQLDRAGWIGPAADAQLIAGRLALELGLMAEAEARLGPLGRSCGRGPAQARAGAWHAAALLRQARGDLHGADRALRAGTRILARHQAVLGATGLRVQVGDQSAELADLGVRLALESGRPERVLAWAERCQAGSLVRPAPRPPADRELAGSLAELRHVVHDLEQVGFLGGDGGALVLRRTALEARISRARASAARAVRTEPPGFDELRAALGGAVLVEFVAHDGRLYAIVVGDRRARLVALAPVAAVRTEVTALRFALGRLARRRTASVTRTAASASYHFGSQALDALLLQPLGRDIADRPLVIVANGPVEALPWSTLPSCRGREVTVAPSAALWLKAAASNEAAHGPTVLVAGPGLVHASAEVDELARAHARATTLTGTRATARGVTAALDGASLVHLAVEGRFRRDNPLFSSLRLADGPLTVYDLDRLRTAPRHVVVSGGDAELATGPAGGELMGLAAALVGLGTRSIVASSVAVPGGVSRALMVDLHRRLAAGAGPAAALAGALVAVGGDERDMASTAGYTCYGAA